MAVIPPWKNSIVNDAGSIAVSSVRRAIQGRTQNQNVLGIPRKGPSYEELRKKEESMLRGIGTVQNPLEPNIDWRLNAPQRPEYNNPNQRIPRGLIIQDLVDIKNKVILPFVPGALDYNPDSNFVAIPSMGRNNPLYHYTGSEDTLEFVIDWFSNQDDREDVILNCKKLEALTKNDAYGRPPHHVKLIWNEKLFSDATWLIVSAKYKLSEFQAHRNMLPQQAIQPVILKRVTASNPNLTQIQSLTF